MKKICCQNRIINVKNGRCGRILAVFTDAMIELLRIDPEGGPLLRCPQCGSDQRWSRLLSDSNGDLTFEAVDPPEYMPPEPDYADLTVYEQVG